MKPGKRFNASAAGRERPVRRSESPLQPAATIYETSPLKHRRTAEEMAAMLAAIKAILDAEEFQITIRHLFYRLTGLHIIPKTEAGYKGLCSHLSKWRRAGRIQWSAFADNTRWHIKHRTFGSVDDALRNTVQNYRRDLWDTQPYYIEVWVEKDAMASIVSDTANKWGVPVFVCRGFASLSSLYAAAATFRIATEAGKKVIIYHLGDYDPSGVAAGESILKAFRDDFKVDLSFVRIAVTAEQIERLTLPTRPTKTTDTRAAKWKGGECVELDTMPPAEIRQIVQNSIVQHIDRDEWEALQRTEKLEKQTMVDFLAKWEAA